MVKKRSQGGSMRSRIRKQGTVFQAESIQDVAYVKNIPYYKVKWHGFTEQECTWEPVKNLGNFKPQMAEIHKEKDIMVYNSLNELVTKKQKNKKQIKTEESVKRIKKTGGGAGKAQMMRRSISFQSDSTQICIPHNYHQISLESTIRVIDLQQVYHYQTQKIHVIARILKKELDRETHHWVHLQDLKKSNKCIYLLTDFLLENVQFESKEVVCVDEKVAGHDEFRHVNFNQ